MNPLVFAISAFSYLIIMVTAGHMIYNHGLRERWNMADGGLMAWMFGGLLWPLTLVGMFVYKLGTGLFHVVDKTARIRSREARINARRARQMASAKHDADLALLRAQEVRAMELAAGVSLSKMMEASNG